MFDITADDINQLNDTDLRDLVGRLCEAELESHGLSPAAVTWGGDQTAADGGLDVRVAVPPGFSIDGFIPRSSTGFQVKKPDMPRNQIISEMRPDDVIRPVIQKLVGEKGAYIIVSSTGSTSDSALSNRRDALREALEDVDNADQLHTDFYDRTRLATWVRRHPGLITWVKGKTGRAYVGWRPYGPWCTSSERVDDEYLIDDKLRLHIGMHTDESSKPIAQAMDELRDELAQPGKIVRLVGLSGVGKTRLVQALFDARLGERPLPPSLAIYTNLSDNPDPQPTGLASDLMANGTRAVLIVDNCPPDLHRRLSELCSGQSSTLSVLTVEYDIRDDQPEGTQVVTLDTSSPELIVQLIRRRYRHLSQVDARTIAEASGGNARIAVALAETVEVSDTISGLSNEELFQRLFRQRHDTNDALLLTAKVCSLVYSFQGEALSGEEAELPRLAMLAGQTNAELYRHVGELLRRNLMQQRGVWRAVLPHAIANRLAALALEDIPYDLIDQVLISGGTERLVLSFSRRLSFMHDHPRAVSIVKSWLEPDGFLGDISALDGLGQAIFENIASVLPTATLAVLYRADNATTWQQYQSILRSLAYDPDLFERSAQLLARAAIQTTDERDAQEAFDTFVSLFTIYLSGTHATIEQRLGIIESLLRSTEQKASELGLAALDNVLEAMHFSSSYLFEFGARSRDFGYQPRNDADVTRWYGAALTLIECLALNEGTLRIELRDLVARNFRGLWTSTHMHAELERLCRRFSADEFWREGWLACRETIYFDSDRVTPEMAERLAALEEVLRPSSLQDQVRAVVLGNRSAGLDLEDMDDDGDYASANRRLEATARELGVAVAANDEVFSELLPELLRGGNQAFSFGCGLAATVADPSAAWDRLIGGLDLTDQDKRDVQVLRGFLAELQGRDNELTQRILDSALDLPILVAFLPLLEMAAGLDERSVERLKRTLDSGQVPIGMFRNLAYGRASDQLAGAVLKELLLLIAEKPDGFDVALEILYMRLHSDRMDEREHDPHLLEAGRGLLQYITFARKNRNNDHELAYVVKFCLNDPGASSFAADVIERLRQAVIARDTYLSDNDDLLRILFELQPKAVLDGLIADEEIDRRLGFDWFENMGKHRVNPVGAISCEVLIAWCEEDRDRRYPVVASIITYAQRPESGGQLIWSEQAKALLANAPDPKSVLSVFIHRFRPKCWSGSLAAILEVNAQLLDLLEPLVPLDLMPFATEAKAQLEQEITHERQRETERDREQDERFE